LDEDGVAAVPDRVVERGGCVQDLSGLEEAEESADVGVYVADGDDSAVGADGLDGGGGCRGEVVGGGGALFGMDG